MKVVAIAAVADNGVIGSGQEMLWHISEDFRRFKTVTMGHTLIFGRRTFEQIGKLPGRRHIICTRDPHWSHRGWTSQPARVRPSRWRVRQVRRSVLLPEVDRSTPTLSSCATSSTSPKFTRIRMVRRVSPPLTLRCGWRFVVSLVTASISSGTDAGHEVDGVDPPPGHGRLLRLGGAAG